MLPPRYIEGCDEHKIPLVEGRCPKCRDKNGETFILDMQSKCLLEVDKGLCCMICGEVFHAKEGIPLQEWKDALAGFMDDHVGLHGGDPEKVPFSLRFEGNMVRATT